jgi:ubiquinone/menaquinone biosynthesis C-methylase UbiE
MREKTPVEESVSEQTSSSHDHAITSTGHEWSEASYLDNHFLTCQPENEAMLRSVGIQPGWHVLDAGCGGGSFLPLMAELVGTNGRISALDLAPENVALVEAQAKSGKFPCTIEARVASITALPYEDNTFDAVWNANVSEYLTDSELHTTLAEFCRVVHSGGLVAIKEIDATTTQLQPTTPTLLWHLFEARQRHGDILSIGTLRAIELPKWFREAGLTNIWRKTTLAERYAPLRSIEREFIGSIVKFWSDLSKTLDLPAEDLVVWRALSDLNSPDHIFNHPDFYWRAGYVLVVGRVP